MIVELMRFTDCKFFKFRTHIGSSGTIVPEENTLYLSLDPNSQYTISIDGATNSSGIVISDLKSKFPVYFMNIIKDDLIEMQYFEYTDAFIKLLDSLFKRKMASDQNSFKYLELEEPFLNPKLGNKETYKVLKAQFDRIMNRAKQYGIITLSTQPQAWKKVFLEPKKYEWGLKFNRANKSEVRRYGIEILENYYHIRDNYDLHIKLMPIITSRNGFTKGDVWDAFGIDRFLLNQKIISDEVSGSTTTRVGSEMEKTRKSVEVCTFPYEEKKDIDEQKDRIINIISKLYRTSHKLDENADIPIHTFIISDKLSLEDNIRVMGSTFPTGIYYSFVNVSIDIIPELYNGNMKINNKRVNLNAKSKIHLLGYLSR